MQDTVLGAGNLAVNKVIQIPTFTELRFKRSGIDKVSTQKYSQDNC